MKARMVQLTLLVYVLMFIIPTVGAEVTLDLNAFSKDDNLVYSDGVLSLKTNGSSSKTYSFDQSGDFEKFTQVVPDSGGYWDVVGGKAKVSPDPGTSRIGDEKEYALKITPDVEADTITIKYKVNSEEDYDWFMVKCGTEIVHRNSGFFEGEKVITDLPSGKHTFTFLYKKDECGRSGDDTVYLESITFSGGTTKTATSKSVY